MELEQLYIIPIKKLTKMRIIIKKLNNLIKKLQLF